MKKVRIQIINDETAFEHLVFSGNILNARQQAILDIGKQIERQRVFATLNKDSKTVKRLNRDLKKLEMMNDELVDEIYKHNKVFKIISERRKKQNGMY